MNKWLKRIIAVLCCVLLVLIVAVLALPFVIDPNRFKGPIERLAMAQNVQLDLQGPISWQFYPTLGLSLEDVTIAPPEQPERQLARAEAGTAAVELMPLFSRQVRVNEVILDGVAIDLFVDEQGRGSWESLGKQDDQPAPEGETETTDGGSLDVSIERIAINNGSLSYQDRQTGQSAQLQDLSVQLSDVNLNNRLFPLTVDVVLRLSELQNPLRVQFTSQLQADSELDNFALENGKLRIAVADEQDAELTATLSGQANLQADLEYQGQLAVESFSPKAMLSALGQALPATADPAALTTLAFATRVAGTATGFSSEELRLTLDDTQVTGNMALVLPETGAPGLELELSGNSINLDRYLPPEEEGAAEPVDDPAAGPTPLPIDALRALNLNLAMNMSEIVMMEMSINSPRLAVTGNDGLWQLTELSADFYRGKLQSDAQLDARPSQGDTASLQFSARMDGLAVHPLLMDFAEFGDLSGIIDGELEAQTRAATSEQLLENLSAAFVFTSPQLTFQGMNAEYFYCQMATQLGDGSMPDTQWPARTQISDVEGQLTFENSRLTIASLVAYVENLVMTSTGYLDLAEMEYRIRMPMRIAQEKTSASGCLVESNFLQNREVDVLGCAGSLEQMDFAEQCGLDRGAVADLAQQAVRYNVEKRADEKKEEIREDVKEKLRERLGEEEDSTRNLLRDLLNR